MERRLVAIPPVRGCPSYFRPGKEYPILTIEGHKKSPNGRFFTLLDDVDYKIMTHEFNSVHLKGGNWKLENKISKAMKILTSEELIFLSNIAQAHPYSFKDVWLIYDKTHSFAKTEHVLEYATSHGCSIDYVLLNYLIKPKMKKKFSFPVGAKMTVKGGEITVEYDEVDEAKWSPKIGEVVKMPSGSMFIFKRNEALGQVGFGDLCFRDGKVFKSTCKAMTLESMPTTHADRCTFFEALNKAGYKWKAKKLLLTKKEAYTPKSGEFITCEKNKYGNKWLIIWGNVDGNNTHEKISYSPTMKKVATTCCCSSKEIFRPMTDSEKQQLLDALHSAGKDWNAEKKEVVELKWRPKECEVVFIASPIHEDLYFADPFSGSKRDCRCINLGLVFRTKEEAIARAHQMLQL